METQTAAPAVAIGTPVEVDNIARELKKLWQDGGEVMTRASLINLAVYSEALDSLERNTQIISEITQEHACRAIVIAAHCASAADGVEAWINAHCHVSGAGGKQVCSEQLSFLLEGSFAKLLPNIVFSHLDSDLPFYLWWQGDLPATIDPQLWTWVDRLIYDSRDWPDFAAQMRRVETAQAEANQRIVLCDLNWTRLISLRRAVAQFFDGPASLRQLADVGRVEIHHSAGFRSTAVLLAGWLAAQLRWTLRTTDGSAALSFSDRAGKSIAVVLAEADGAAIGSCSLFAGQTEFCVTHARDADLLHASMILRGEERSNQLVPAAGDDSVSLIREELMRGGPHLVYLRALASVRPLLEAAAK